MAKDEPAATLAVKKEPTREEALAAQEIDNAARAVKDHVFPDSTVTTKE